MPQPQIFAQTLQLTSQDRCLNVMPLYHIHGIVAGLLASLSAGASVVCPPAFDPEAFFAWLAAFRPTWYTAVPTMHQAILARAEAYRDLMAQSQLRFIRSSSAALPPRLHAALAKTFQTPVLEAYGMTEAAHQIASNPLPAGQQKTGSVGLAAGPEVAIMDAAGQLLPAETIGEIVVRGANVMPGYEQNDAANQQAFTDGWFRTGDEGRLDTRGYLFITGRLKEMINRGGFKIAPREVEDVFLEHAAVAQAITFPVPHPTLGEDVVTAVIVHPSATLTEQALRAFVLDRLAEYKVPSHILFVDAIPTGATGKFQRSSLEQHFAPMLQASAIAPRDEVEETLIALWHEVLGSGDFGVEHNFFALGGDSLRAAQLIARIRKEFQVDLPLLSIFQAPTVASQAALLRDILAQQPPGLQAEGAAQSQHTPPTWPETPRPLSSAQRHLWLVQQFRPDTVTTTRPMALRLTGQLDRDALQQSLSAMVRRHEVLRTVYQEYQGEPCQVVLPPQPVTLARQDFQHMPAGEREEAAQRYSAQQVQHTVFDLTTGPMLRATLLTLAEHSHILLLLLHHIAVDGWSETILIQELAMLYDDFSQRRPASLPPLPMQYADFAVWQQQQLSSHLLDGQLAYWRQQLAGWSPALALPGDYARSDMAITASQRGVLLLPLALAEQLESLSRHTQTTLFMTLLAAFSVLLGRYTQQEDVAVGTLTARRTLVETEKLIGYFADTLVLRTDLTGQPTFRELLSRVRDMTLAAYAHQDVPFAQVAEAIQLTRGRQHAPPIQVLFQLRNMPGLPATTAGTLHIAPFAFDAGNCGVELDVQITRTDRGLQCVFDYATALFHPETIARLAEQYQTLLEAVVAQPDQSIQTLSMVSVHQRQHMLVTWNDTQTAPQPFSCIHTLFEAQVAATPHAVAVSCGTEQLTYTELNRQANQLACSLQRLGVGPEVLVGICLERSIAMLVGVLGVLKAGGAFLPILPTTPHERLAFILGDARVAVVLTQDHVRDRLAIQSRPLVCLDTDWDRIARESGENPISRVSAENVAYVIYTSGSTGQPKGVLIAHRGIGSMIQAQIDTFDVQPQSRVLQFAPLSFDAAVSEIFMALLAGATLVIPTADDLLAGPPLLELLREQAITTVTLPPSVLTGLPNEALPRLHTLIVAGEACAAHLARHWADGRHFFNAYGPTEATVCTTIAEATGENWQPVIGRPIANMQTYVLDTSMQPVAIGVPGELYIGGIGLARGYLHRPDLTAEKFVAHPFSQDPAVRLYKTGDLVRYRHNGAVEFLGRIDQQVKLRGFRIELEEIAATLRCHAHVHNSVVVVQTYGENDQRLVAYIVPAQGAMPTSNQLRAFLQQKLPDYMVPSFYVVLEALPLTPHGKVDRRALPVLDAVRPELDQTFVPPRNPAEAELADIWCELLGLEHVGVYDNLFELGGHSLLLARLATRIAEVFQVKMPLHVLFDLATIDAMILAILERQAESADEMQIDHMLEKLTQLSSDEVIKLLRT